MEILTPKMCHCCRKRKVKGKCIINGIRQNLPNTCRYCFLRNPEDKESTRTKHTSPDYHRYHQT